jgi:membrane protein DedA with SNARE-associated domain
MDGFEQQVIYWLTELSQHPFHLYIAVVLILTASSFGLPLPEEVVLITCGLVGSIALTESKKTGLPPTIDIENLALVCFLAVFLSDFLVFFLGRKLGTPLLQKKPFNKVLTPEVMQKIEHYTKKFGPLACGVFRFTPGLRFPGHFMCGALKVSYKNFILVDGFAALVSVPTQVLLIGYYGESILVHFKEFKIALLILLVLGVIGWFIYRRPRPYKPVDSGS